jgi:hypothetical protein
MFDLFSVFLGNKSNTEQASVARQGCCFIYLISLDFKKQSSV